MHFWPLCLSNLCNGSFGPDYKTQNNRRMEVSSEILPFFQRDSLSQPFLSKKNVVSRFSFSYPCHDEGKLCHNHKEVNELEKDADDDYVVRRKGDINHTREVVIILEHGISTKLMLVGLQIWRGALLLADFLIHSREQIENQSVLELGAGVGLTSIVAGICAKRIICTDVDRDDILRLLRHNIATNKGIIKSQVEVHKLDFFDGDWGTELNEAMKEITVILAADVIYDNDVTEAFIETITKILNIPPKKTLYIALEKRYVFTVSDLDVVAPCYEYMLTCLQKVKTKEPFLNWKVEDVDLDFPQYFNYDRVKEMVMIKISS